jgi:cyclic pyranopterin phosphate synthase
MLESLTTHCGPIRSIPRRDSSPASRFALPDGTTFGIVASMTQPFCASCDRSRLTADGLWYRCLYARSGTDLRTLLRNGASDDDLRVIVADEWTRRSDRGAVDRLALPRRRPSLPLTVLKDDPHLEMHTRGG